MKLTKIDSGVLCDMGGCVKKAAYSVSMEGKPPFTRLSLCPDCAGQLKKLLDKELGGKKEVKNEKEVCRRDS